MGLIQNLIAQHQKKIRERNEACEALIFRIDDALRDAKSIFSAPQAFVDPLVEYEWRCRNIEILTNSESSKILWLKKADKYKTLTSKRAELDDIAYSMTNRILQHNERAASIKVQAAYSLSADIHLMQNC